MPLANAINAIENGFQSLDALTGTFKGRSLTGSGAVNVTNGDGVAGNPVFSVAPGATAFEVVTTTTKAAAINTTYVADNAAGVNFTLPATAPAGSVVEIIFKQGRWVVTPSSGQQIILGTTTGTTTTGTLTSLKDGDCVRLRCTVSNLTWVVTGCQGQFNLS